MTSYELLNCMLEGKTVYANTILVEGDVSCRLDKGDVVRYCPEMAGGVTVADSAVACGYCKGGCTLKHTTVQ